MGNLCRGQGTGADVRAAASCTSTLPTSFLLVLTFISSRLLKTNRGQIRIHTALLVDMEATPTKLGLDFPLTWPLAEWQSDPNHLSWEALTHPLHPPSPLTTTNTSPSTASLPSTTKDPTRTALQGSMEFPIGAVRQENLMAAPTNIFRNLDRTLFHWKHLLCAVIILQDCQDLWLSHNLCDDIHAGRSISFEKPRAFAFMFYSDTNRWSMIFSTFATLFAARFNAWYVLHTSVNIIWNLERENVQYI